MALESLVSLGSRRCWAFHLRSARGVGGCVVGGSSMRLGSRSAVATFGVIRLGPCRPRPVVCTRVQTGAEPRLCAWASPCTLQMAPILAKWLDRAGERAMSTMEWNRLLAMERVRELVDGDGSGTSDHRSPFQSDYDRVVFSSTVGRRLQDKAQVFPARKPQRRRADQAHALAGGFGGCTRAGITNYPRVGRVWPLVRRTSRVDSGHRGDRGTGA